MAYSHLKPQSNWAPPRASPPPPLVSGRPQARNKGKWGPRQRWPSWSSDGRPAEQKATGRNARNLNELRAEGATSATGSMTSLRERGAREAEPARAYRTAPQALLRLPARVHFSLVPTLQRSSAGPAPCPPLSSSLVPESKRTGNSEGQTRKWQLQQLLLTQFWYRSQAALARSLPTQSRRAEHDSRGAPLTLLGAKKWAFKQRRAPIAD